MNIIQSLAYSGDFDFTGGENKHFCGSDVKLS